MAGITLTGLVLTQLDRVILSRTLSLETFGYYVLGSVIAGGLYVVIHAVFGAVFPRLSALVSRGDTVSVVHLYHQGTQAMAVLVLPVAVFVALFSADILVLWTGDAQVAEHAAPIASLLVLGTAINGLMFLPYGLQLAYGLTSLSLRINITLVVVMVPTLLLAVQLYSAAGAAWTWIGVNVLYMGFAVPLTHQRVLRGEATCWFAKDIVPPLVAAFSVVTLGRLVLTDSSMPATAVVALGATLACAMVASSLAADLTRAWLIARVMQLRVILAASGTR
jgi:O-antigen/teichoic acid export membrane protein